MKSMWKLSLSWMGNRHVIIIIAQDPLRIDVMVWKYKYWAVSINSHNMERWVQSLLTITPVF